MFGMSMPEILLILAVALIVIGPKKLPDLAKSLGRGFREFKSATRELKESIDLDPGVKNIRDAFDGIDEEVRDAVRGKSAGDATAQDAATPTRSAEPTPPSPDTDPTEPEPDAGYQEALNRVQEAFGEGSPEGDGEVRPDAPTSPGEDEGQSPGSSKGDEGSKGKRHDG
ncbi:MAG: twin-arginine translocase TatA/TatE family subunit [Desulfobacteraceae bacterium]|nr:twin-arginine translocase TatA/TatE family subunit [Desulfobacteraceae bacterium]